MTTIPGMDERAAEAVLLGRCLPDDSLEDLERFVGALREACPVPSTRHLETHHVAAMMAARPDGASALRDRGVRRRRDPAEVRLWARFAARAALAGAAVLLALGSMAAGGDLPKGLLAAVSRLVHDLPGEEKGGQGKTRRPHGSSRQAPAIRPPVIRPQAPALPTPDVRPPRVVTPEARVIDDVERSSSPAGPTATRPKPKSSATGTLADEPVPDPVRDRDGIDLDGSNSGPGSRGDDRDEDGVEDGGREAEDAADDDEIGDSSGPGGDEAQRDDVDADRTSTQLNSGPSSYPPAEDLLDDRGHGGEEG